MTECLISLGSNLGDRRQQLDDATSTLATTNGIEVLGRSTLRETAPAGGPSGQDAFLNGCLLIKTNLSARQVFARLIEIERDLGRTRSVRWDSRSVDLDLLIYGETIRDDPDLTLPHPRMAFRRFVLEPAVEVAAHLVHPQLRWTMQELLDHLNRSRPYVAITGSITPQLFSTITNAASCIAVHGSLPLLPQSSSLEPSAWIESLKHCLRSLASVDWNADRFVISDFWLDALRFSIARCPEDRRAELTEAFGTVATCAPQPMLVVLLQEVHSTAHDDVANSLRRIVTSAGRGPFLVLAASDEETVVQEVVGALQSMKRSDDVK